MVMVECYRFNKLHWINIRNLGISHDIKLNVQLRGFWSWVYLEIGSVNV
jgi:hypothetical protein